MKPPINYQELRALLQQRMPFMSHGQQKIARLLLKDPQGTAFRAISDTAVLAGVHKSSVVRFATSLGLNGYPGLVALCRDQLAIEADLVSRFGVAEKHSQTGDFLSDFTKYEQQNLRRTFARISADDWQQTVTWLAAKESQVHIMGLRKCLSVAQLMAYLLHMVRPDVHQVAPVLGALVDDLRDMQPNDVFVAISIHRYTADTVRAFAEAKKRGLHTIALTDSAASPLVRDANISFLVDCEGVTVLRSVAAFISLAQALATAVALRSGKQSREQLLNDEQLLTSFSVYSE